MKKGGYLLTVCLTAAVLAACGGSEDAAGESTAAVSSEAADQTESEAAPAEETETSAEAGAEAGAEMEAEAAGEKPAAGTWEGNVYTDPFAGIQLTIPEGWTAADSAAMESMFGSTETDEGIYSMMAFHAESGENVIMMYENLDETAGILQGITDEAAYFSAIEDGLVDQGFTVDGEPTEQTIGDHTYLCEKTSMESDGVEIDQYYMIRKIDSYMFCIIFSLQGGASLEDCLAMLA